MGLRPGNRRDNYEKNGRLGYVQIGWDLRTCNRRDSYDRNSRLGM
jgi:hypothetical protein